ncbi:MAG TPA: sigma-54 dependent transcriptional regulator [Syntrophales bacterium]|nr:sigma-54 dependent transcriptional regulator [Syntrophales bacterium]
MSGKRILVVDDENLIRRTLQKSLEKDGYGVILAATGEEALQKIREEAPDLALIDIHLPGMDGFEVLEKALQIDQSVIPIMITVFEDVDSVVRSIKLGAFDYIAKPFDFNKVRLSIEKALEMHRLKGEVRHLRQERKGRSSFGNIIWTSQEMRRILEMTEKVANTDAATVLIQGESGTGKEMIAQAVHDLSKRSNMPFITLNCPGVAEQLLENELCGHEKGAYTDAKETKKGLLEVADGGALFLDEIGDMGPSLQAKVLRLIEQKTYRRVGGIKDRQADVRIIAATNKDLRKLMAEGRFREDLFYRINIVALHIPSLRERRDDILPLAKHFIDKYNLDFHKTVRKMSEKVEHYFMAYDWPGNVRELRNVIERAMILGEGDTLLLEHLPMEIVGGKQEQRTTGPIIPPEGISLEKLEESLVREALKMTAGNQTRSARLLGISRDSLRYRMQKLDI